MEAHTTGIKYRAAIVLLLVLAGQAWGQGTAGTGGGLEPRFLVDVPTAGMLDKGTVALDVGFYQEGGVLVGISAGILDRLSFGISYGGSKLIGSSKPEMNEIPGINVRIRIIEESLAFPAIALGFDSQGKDGYLKDEDRYRIKSPGFFAVASKNYALLGFFSLHGGVNYSLERADDDKDINLFVGAEKTIGPFVSVVAEYNIGMNDNSGNAVGRGRGYLNAGLKISLGSGLTIGVNLKDFIKNGRDITVANRTVQLEYARAF
ncbi:MAG TPA: YjbH domain-containing protein [Bacteroidota bacterium]|nr:YjbH domain-containing protein [Bacteroidota bacterium]